MLHCAFYKMYVENHSLRNGIITISLFFSLMDNNDDDDDDEILQKVIEMSKSDIEPRYVCKNVVTVWYRSKVASHLLAIFCRVNRTTRSSFEYHCTRKALDLSEQVEDLEDVNSSASLYHSS